VTALDTDALVLHLFDYRETSRIVRLVTRDAGVVSVLARGARRPRNRFGAALDLFASGVAHVAMHGSGDLHALHAFDATRSRPELATSLDRFAAAAMLGELCLRFAPGAETGAVYDAAVAALDAVGGVPHSEVATAALAGAWRLVAEFGFAPAVDRCAHCHEPIPSDAAVTFHYRAGGALCARCARNARGGRRLPTDARAALAGWLAQRPVPAQRGPDARAHARVLREFLEEHLGDGKPLRAFLAWEERLARASGPAAP
jgi:DNA repair protein RecO (recombination protein O)